MMDPWFEIFAVYIHFMIRENWAMGTHSDIKYSLRIPNELSIYQLIKKQSEDNPEAYAILAPECSPLTYKNFITQIDNTLRTLRSLGINRNDRLAVVLPNGLEMAVSFAAITSAATCAPLNPFYRLNEFEFYMRDLNTKGLIVLSGMDSPAREVAKKLRIPIFDLIPTHGAGAGVFDLVGKQELTPGASDFATPDDIALVLHTSGTTSRPKIVPLTNEAICHSGHNIALTLQLKGNDRCLNVMPLFHIHGLIGALFSSWTAGASVVCTSGFDVLRFFEFIDTFQPTWYTAVPSMHQAVLTRASANRDIIARRPLRFIRSCSASLPEQVMVGLEEQFNAPVIDSFGMTEAAHQITSNPLPPLPRKAGSVGVAAGPDVAIMSEEGTLLSAGQIGEVVIRGENVTNGYENNPSANESSYNNGWFHTGDQGRFDSDGYLFITGRIKEIINKGGEKIGPKEVDEVLLKHPAVAQTITFAVPHPTLGEDIAAAIVLKENSWVSESKIRDFAVERLTDFKVPSQLIIVDQIPKGPTGKIRRNEIADKLASKLKNNYVAPKNTVEKQLADIWKDILKIDPVGVRDNFYALGGDSLASAAMLIGIEGHFRCEINRENFMMAPTIETIANLIQEKDKLTFGIHESRIGSLRIREKIWGWIIHRFF